MREITGSVMPIIGLLQQALLESNAGDRFNALEQALDILENLVSVCEEDAEHEFDDE